MMCLEAMEVPMHQDVLFYRLDSNPETIGAEGYSMAILDRPDRRTGFSCPYLSNLIYGAIP